MSLGPSDSFPHLALSDFCSVRSHQRCEGRDLHLSLEQLTGQGRVSARGGSSVQSFTTPAAQLKTELNLKYPQYFGQFCFTQLSQSLPVENLYQLLFDLKFGEKNPLSPVVTLPI